MIYLARCVFTYTMGTITLGVAVLAILSRRMAGKVAPGDKPGDMKNHARARVQQTFKNEGLARAGMIRRDG